MGQRYSLFWLSFSGVVNLVSFILVSARVIVVEDEDNEARPFSCAGASMFETKIREDVVIGPFEGK